MKYLDESERFQRKAIQAEEAQNRVEEYIQLMGTEEIRLEYAQGRRIAEDIVANHNLPHFRRSGMDGYAIQAEATKGISAEQPCVLEVIEELPCGAVPTQEVKINTAARIMTGAMVPEGADAVVMLEVTQTYHQDGKMFVSMQKEQMMGQNITPVGMEMKQGDPLMSRGRKLGVGEIAVLATFGHARIKVFQRPKVAIFATGSELLPIDEPLQSGKIYNSNTYMLSAQVKNAGGNPIVMGAFPDQVELAESKIFSAFKEADVVITTGGVSVGDYDILTEIFSKWEGEMLFNKLTMRPGSVTTVGVWQEKLLFALSGNPGACFVAFELFARPVIEGVQGKEKPFPEKQTAYLADDFMKVNAYTRYVRGASYIENGKLYVKPVGIDQSSITVSIKDTDCLIVFPPGGQGVPAGELVDMILLRKNWSRECLRGIFTS